MDRTGNRYLFGDVDVPERAVAEGRVFPNPEFLDFPVLEETIFVHRASQVGSFQIRLVNSQILRATVIDEEPSPC